MVREMIEFLMKNAENNNSKLPKIEDFPIKEQTLLVLYYQTYTITKIGLPTASLIMQGVLMEHFINFLYYHHKNKEFKGKDLFNLIKACKDENLFSKDSRTNENYYNFFDDFRRNIRIPQIHFLSQRQTKGMGVRGVRLKIPIDVTEEEFKKLTEDAIKNFSEKSEILSTAENPAIANALKIEIDNKTYLEQFCEFNRKIMDLNKINNLDHNQG